MRSRHNGNVHLIPVGGDYFGDAGGKMARRPIDPEIRAEAVARWRAGEPTGIIASDLGVDPTTIRQWGKSVDGDVRPARAARSTRGSDDYASESESGDSAPSTDEPPKMHWIGMMALGGIAVAGIVLAARANSVTEFPENGAPWRADLLTAE